MNRYDFTAYALNEAINDLCDIEDKTQDRATAGEVRRVIDALEEMLCYAEAHAAFEDEREVQAWVERNGI